MRLDWATARDLGIAILFVAGCFVALPCIVVASVALLPLAMGCLACVLFVYFAKWFFGCDDSLPAPNDESETGISESLWALAFILTQVIAVAASQLGRFPLSEVPLGYIGRISLLYIPVTVAVLGAVIGMLRSKKEVKGGVVTRTFNSGSLMFMRFVLGWGLFFAIGMPVFAVLGWLPTQAVTGKTALNDWQAEPSALERGPEKGSPDVLVSVPISKTQFADGLPSELMLSVQTGADLTANGWGVRDGELYVGSAASKIKHKTAPNFTRYLQNPQLPPVPEFGINLKELNPNQSYTLVLVLWKPKDSKDEAARIASQLNDKKDKLLNIQSVWVRY